MNEKIYVSRDGLEKLKADLVQCKEQRMKIAATIEHARELGDLKENAEYHAAKEAQALLHARMREMEDKIARAAVLEDEDIDASKAYIGAAVRVLDEKTKKEVTYTLVGPVEVDMAAGKISTRSLVGEALLGKSVGDTVVAKVPAGDLRLTILEISR